MRDEATHELFLRFRDGGDLAALGEVFDRTARDLGRLARALAPEASAAEDLLQATFVKAIESAGRFDGARPVEPWLAGILANEARNARRRARHSAELAGEPAVDDDPLAAAEGAEVARVVAGALASLPRRQRELLEPLLAGDASRGELARRLGRSPGTVRMQVHRALGRLRAALPPSFATGALVAWLTPRGRALARVRAEVLRRGAARAGVAPIASTSPWLLGGLAMSAKIALVPLVLLAALAAWQLVPEVPAGAHRDGTVALDAVPEPARLLDPPTPARAAPEEPGRAVVAAPAPAEEGDAWEAALAGVRGRILEADGTPVAHAPLALVELEPLRIVSADPGAGLEALRAPTLLAAAGVTDAGGRFVLRGTLPHAVHAIAVDPRGERSALLVLDRALRGAETTDLGDLFLPPAARLVGRVVDGRGEPVAGARVRTMHLPESIHVADLRVLAELRPGGALAVGSRRGAAVVELEPWMCDLVDSLPLPAAETDADGRFALRASFDPDAVLIADRAGLAPAVVGPLARPAGGGELDVGDVVLDAGATLAARVRDAAGEPVEEAEVLLGHGAEGSWADVLHRAEATAPGRYAAGGLLGGRSALAAARRGPAEPWTVAVADGGAEVVELTLGGAHPVELVLRDASGKPVRDAELAWCPQSPLTEDFELGFLARELPLFAETVAPGRWRAELPPGEHLLWVTAAGARSRHRIEVERPRADGEVERIGLALPAARAVAVEVVDATTGAPVARASVTVLDDERWPTIHAAARTGADGRAALPPFATANEALLLHVQHPAYAAATRPLGVEAAARVELGAGGAVEGRVVLEGGLPETPLVFNLTPGGRGWSPTGRIARFATVAPDGSFRLDRVPPGDYRWEVATNFLADTLPLALGGRLEDFYDMDKGHFEDTWARGMVRIAPGETARVEAVVESRALPAGRVEGRLLVRGVPRAGASIRLVDEERVHHVTRTDRGGAFVFRAVAEGDARLGVPRLDAGLGSVARPYSVSRGLEVVPGEVAFVEIDLQPTALAVEVLGEGRALADAVVWLMAEDASVSARTDEAGIARLESPVAGEARWRVQADGWGIAEGATTLEPGARDAPLSVELERTAPCAGRVAWPALERRAGENAALHARLPGSDEDVERAWLDDDRRFAFRWLVPGPYDLVVRRLSDDALSEPVRVELHAGGAEDLDLVFERAAP